MAYIPLEKLLHEEKKSLYQLVLAAAARANELTQGSTPLVECSSKKVSTVSLSEIAGDKVSYETTTPKKKKK